MNNQLNRGFTLIEVAMVVLIAGLMMTGILGAINTLRKSTGLNETSERLNTIEIALRTFISRNNRLPCPADPKLDVSNQDWGVEYDTGTAGFCHDDREVMIGTNVTYIGVLPLRSLEFNDEFLDSWDHHYTYHILKEVTQPNAVTNTLWPNDVFDVYNMVDDVVANTGGTTRFPNDKPVLIIVSHGPNGSGAWMRTTGDETTESTMPAPPATALNELENLDAVANDDGIYINADYSADDDTPFDDLVIALTENRLLRPLEEQGILKTKDHLTRYKMDLIVDAIYGFSVRNDVDPDGNRTPSANVVTIGASTYAGSCLCGSEVAPVGTVVALCTDGCRSITHRIPYADNTGDGIEDPADTSDNVPYSDLDLDSSDVIDGWGNQIIYLPHTDAASTSVSASPSDDAGIFSGSNSLILTLRSIGPNNTDNGCTVDDICVYVNRSEALGKFASAGIKVD